MNEIHGTVIEARVNDEKNGLLLSIVTDDGKFKLCTSTIEDQWLKIPEGLDAATELAKVAALFNGHILKDDGTTEPIPAFELKRVTIIEN